MNYQLQLPEKIIFGRGTRKQLASVLPHGPVLFVTGAHFAARVETEFLPDLAGRPCRIVSGIHPEPPLDDVERVRQAAREINATAIVGIGGGSAMDCAKAAAALLPESGTVADYFYGKKKISGRGAFFAALPTTAGTGAEITSNAVLSDPGTGLKQSLRHASMFAKVAIVDPELTYDCPPAVTAASGFDALTQAIESYISRNANIFSKLLALQAARNILPFLPVAVDEGAARHEARDLIAEGSMLAAMAFAQSGLGAVHGIGHPAGAVLHVPHGVCCAILLPTVLRWNLPSCREQLGELSAALIGQTPEVLIQMLEGTRRMLKLPSNFRSYGLKPEHFAFIVENCRSGSMKSNPRDLSDKEVAAILEELL